MADGERITGDGWTLEAVATPGHASNHVAYALDEENALFCGDHVMGWSTTVISPPDGDMGDYYASLDKVQARGFATLWPTHGPPILDVDPFLTGYRDHRLKREEQIVRELGRGPRTISEMLPRLYVGVDPRLHGAASRSMLAHLIHMTRTGRVQAQGAPTPGSGLQPAVMTRPRRDGHNGTPRGLSLGPIVRQRMAARGRRHDPGQSRTRPRTPTRG